MRRPIIPYGVKIFAIAILLIGLMAATTGASIHFAKKIRTRLGLLAEAYLPLSHELADIEAKALEQHIEFEHLLAALDAARPDSEEIAARRKEWESYRAATIKAINDARVEISQEIAEHNSPEVTAELSNLQANLDNVAQKHSHWQEHVAILLQDHLAHTGSSITEEIVEREEAEFARSVGRLRHQMGAIALEAARQAESDERSLREINIAVTAFAAVVGLLCSALLTIALVRPVRSLLFGMREVESGRLNIEVDVRSRDELGRLTSGFNTMVGEFRVKKRITDTFGRFVDPRIVRNLIDRPEITSASGRRQEMSILFSDIANFTSISEQLAPADLVRLLNAYFSAMSEPITEQHGVIDKFIGDAILAYWGTPFVPEGEHAERACRAALAQRDCARKFDKGIPALLGLTTGAPSIKVRIGVATGSVIVGTIGSEVSRNYTVIGDRVNIGSRLEAACKIYDTPTLIDHNTALLVKETIALREIDSVRLLGRTDAERVFEPLDLVDPLPPEQAQLTEAYKKGLTAYRDHNWSEALDAFRRCLDIAPQDGPSRTLRSRVETFVQSPPSANWDTVWRQQDKS